jgi:hypothetical protein
MAKKKKISKRQNNWPKLKSAVWKIKKDSGLYSYNSKKFNELVSEVYERSGKKRNVARLDILTEQIESELFLQAKSEFHRVAYFDIARELQSLQLDSKYDSFTVQTNFQGEYKDVKFKLEDFEYDGSFFQNIVQKADSERKASGQTFTPNQNLKVTIDPKNQKIIISVEGAKNENKKNKPFKIKTPESIISKTKRLEKVTKDVTEYKDVIWANSKALLDIYTSNLAQEQKVELSKTLAENIKSLRQEQKQLTNEQRQLEKYLSDTGGFKESKSAGKKKRK